MQIKLTEAEILDIVHRHLVKKLNIDESLRFRWSGKVNTATNTLKKLVLEVETIEESE